MFDTADLSIRRGCKSHSQRPTPAQPLYCQRAPSLLQLSQAMSGHDVHILQILSILYHPVSYSGVVRKTRDQHHLVASNTCARVRLYKSQIVQESNCDHRLRTSPSLGLVAGWKQFMHHFDGDNGLRAMRLWSCAICKAVTHILNLGVLLCNKHARVHRMYKCFVLRNCRSLQWRGMCVNKSE